MYRYVTEGAFEAVEFVFLSYYLACMLDILPHIS